MTTRYISTLVKASLKLFPAVLLLGPRQVGKSTVAQELAAQGAVTRYITLDDLTTLTSISADPDAFLKTLTEPVALDEIQRAPDLMRALKKNIDEDRQKGRFLLTGSSNILAHPKVSESLAGRTDVFMLEGLSLAELRGLPAPQFCRLLLQGSLGDFQKFLRELESKRVELTQNELLESIFFGGFPEVALSHDSVFRERYFQAYQTIYVEKDIRDLARGVDIIQFGQLARVLLTQSGQLTNIKNLSNDLGLDQRTVKRYVELLEISFQTITLAPWHRSSLKRLIKTAKIYARDSGLMSFMHHFQAKNEMIHSIYWGAVLETFFFAELRKQSTLIPGVTHSFYRTHQGKEVDFVLEYGSKLVGIELKASSSVNSKDFAGLEDLQEANKGHLDFGLVLYQGDKVVFFADNRAAVPMKYFLLC